MVRGIRSYHPLTIFSYFFIGIILIFLYSHPLFLIAALFLFIFTNLLLDQGKELEKWVNIILVLSLVTIVLNPLFNHRGNTIIGYLFNNPITLEAIIQGLIYALNLTTIFLLFITFNLIFTPNMFTFLFSKFSKQWTIVLLLTMRFVPQLRKNIQDLQDIQKLKGISMTEGSLSQRAKNGMQFIQAMLAQSLEESITVADSMTARGYGSQTPSSYEHFEMKQKDYLSLSFILFTFLFLIYGRKINRSNLQIQPILGSLWIGGIQNILLFFWFLFFSFILFIEGKEIFKWKYYQYKNFPLDIQKRNKMH